MSASPPTGNVTFFSDGQQQPPAALKPIYGTHESKASVSIVIVNAGAQMVTAVYDGDFLNSVSSSNLALPSDGPTVLSVQRYGVHDQATTLVLTFSGQLNAGSATNPVNYELISAMGLPISIEQADYNTSGGSFTVTLHLERRLNLHRFYELTVIGTGPSGLAGASGLLLDGAGNGSPGSDYVTSVTGRDLVKTNAIGAELREDRAMARVSQIARLRVRQR